MYIASYKGIGQNVPVDGTIKKNWYMICIAIPNLMSKQYFRNQDTKMAWKINRLTNKELCHGNDIWHVFHQDNAPVHKSVVEMAAVHDFGFELVDHPPFSADLAPSDYVLFPNLNKTLGWEVVSDRWWGHTCICSWGLFRGSGWQIIYHGNASAATPMKEVCGPQGRLCWKINHIWSNSTIAS